MRIVHVALAVYAINDILIKRKCGQDMMVVNTGCNVMLRDKNEIS